MTSRRDRSRTFALTFALTFAFTFAFAAAFGAEARADISRAARFIRDRGTAEFVLAQGGWRTAIGTTRTLPGFDVLGGGGELVIGLDFASAFGVILDGRVLSDGYDSNAYFEGQAGLGFQLRANNRVQVRLAATGGEVRRRGERAPLVGGFLSTSIMLFSLGAGRLGVTLNARLDFQGVLTDRPQIPEALLGLCVGLGLRY